MAHHPQFGYFSLQDHDRGLKPEPGCLIAHDFKPWRVIDIRYNVERNDLKYTVYRMRPVDAGDNANQDIHWGWTGYSKPEVIREHYSLCVHCGELPPCREVLAERTSDRAQKRMARYEMPGVCPACEEPVTHRQERETFPNTVVPLGPAVTFHAGRRKCRAEMERYRRDCAQPDAQLRLDGGES